MIKLKILKRLKLLFINDDLVDFTINLNNKFINIDSKNKHEWKTYDRIHKILNIMENHSKNPSTTKEWYTDRIVEISFKLLNLKEDV
jgi:hypothetical protein